MAKTISIAIINEKGSYVLPFSQSEISAVNFADVDLVVTSKGGASYILPGGALAAMDSKPPLAVFADGNVPTDKLLGMVVSTSDLSFDIQTVTSLPVAKKDETKDEAAERQKLAHDLQKAHDDLAKSHRDFEKQEEQLAQQHAQIDQQAKELDAAKQELAANKDIADKIEASAAHEALLNAPDAANHESSVDKFTEKMSKLISEIHSKDFDYVPVQPYQPPSQVFMGPPGVPAPLSMTPLVTLTMGNVVGTQSTVDGMGVTTIYGGGGALGTTAEAKLGPRDPLQFSAATITGTAGDDIIYAQGPLLGNADPSVNTDNYAKQFLLKIAGYFTELNDVVFKGLPSFASVTNGVHNADGSWSLSSSYVLKQQAFEIVYDKNDARAAATQTFDMTVEVTGMMRGTEFNSLEKFRFQFLDVTDVSQVTDAFLTYWDDGMSKQIYILPTLDQPNTISAGNGDDRIYGSQSHDTIDAGAGNDQVWGFGGNNNIIGGDGNDTIIVTTGNNTLDGGSGNNSITAGDGVNQIVTLGGDDTIIVGHGSNIIDAGAGINVITAGNGSNTLTTGSGDDTITVGNGNNVIHAGDGINVLVAGDGLNTIVTGSGDDTITAGNGGNIIDAGDGNNAVTTGSGNDIIRAGAGNDTLQAGDGDDTLAGGLGTNTLDGGTGRNTVDYSGIGIAVTASLAANTGTGAGLSDTFANIHNITGSALDDTLTGSASDNILSGGAGNDTIVGGGGNDTVYGNDGNDTLTGGAGNDVIEGGSGADTIRGGGGTDILRGGAGDDIFLNPTAGTVYDGGEGTDKVDYSAETNVLTIDLYTGMGTGGTAQGSTYTNIEWIVGGTNGDRLTGGIGNDILEGGAGNDTLSGGLGANTLSGGTGSNYYVMGAGADFVNAMVGQWDEIQYNNSPAGVVVNLDTVAHSFTNSKGATVTVAALSGGNLQANAIDASSWSIGDTYTDGGIEYVIGGLYDDVIYANPNKNGGVIYGNNGNDLIFGAANNDNLYASIGNDRIDGAGGIDYIYVGWSGGNMTAYLDGYADTNGNGKADYIDRNVTSLPGSGYTGFVYGWSGQTLLTNIEDIIGGTGADYLVGDANNNEINGRTNNNIMYGLGGDDTFYAFEGANTIDGGTGNDTVSFIREGHAAGYSGSDLTTGMYCYLADADLNSDGFMDKASTWGLYSSMQARTSLGGINSYSSIVNVENIHGSNYDDYLAGDANANIIYGYSGNDRITGNGGADQLYGHNGNDTFVIAAADMPTVVRIDGGNNTDTIKSAGWTFASGAFNAAAENTKFANIEAIDVRNSVAGGAYGLNATDVRNVADLGNSSVLQLYLDTGDTFSAVTGAGTGSLTVLNTLHTATDDQYKFYSDAGHTINNSINLVAVLNVHYGA